jgi:putative NADH-flavin reductase
MNVLILGATGGTGVELVKQSLAKGHSVTALVRSPDRLASFESCIAIRQGNLLDISDLSFALEGQDAVLSAFGPRTPIVREERKLLQKFAAALIPALSRTGVKRLLVESVAFLFKDAWLPPVYLIGKLFFPSVVADASAMESIIGQSPLDWTLVRPPELTNKPHPGQYRMRNGHLPRFGISISRANVADCFLQLLEDQTSIRKIIGVSN